VASWLAEHDGNETGAASLFEELCLRLCAAGMPLFRASTGLPAMHPQTFAIGLEWLRGERAVETQRELGIQQTRFYLDSPIAVIHQGAAAIRRRLDLQDAVLDFPILRDVKALGATDYLALPLRFTRGQPTFIAWSTDRPGGFTESELAMLHDLMPLIALRFEIVASRRMTRDLLATYLGRDAGARVLGGAVARGSGGSIRTTIWNSDLRGFTQMADRMSGHDLVTILNDYFDCMVGPIQAHGGDVLKFVGDGVLAMFNAE
jgi:adenylate cyclase